MSYESRLKNQDIDELFEAILTLRDQEDCYRFFEDICTINEIHAIAQRLQVAKLLSEKRTYAEIEALTKASTATISRINKCLVYGADGYRRVLERLKENEDAKDFDLFIRRDFDPAAERHAGFSNSLLCRAVARIRHSTGKGRSSEPFENGKGQTLF